ncbi:MAG: SBBP repeat-containing protein, partial [SAR324 cluster bacterium]|nr:SBBP repeat-containing protein [SAR324 cluster bacterium]
QGNGVTVDNSSNIYVTGYTNGGLDGNLDLGGARVAAGFLVKYNASEVKQ